MPSANMSTSRETGVSTPTFARRSISLTSRGSYIDAIESIELRAETDDPLSGDHLGTYNPIATEESRAPSPDVFRIGPEVQGTVGMPGDARAPCRPLTKLATLRAWTFELLALVVSVASFVAIIILLKMYDGCRQPSFSFSIGVSTLIAVFTTALRASMMFTVAEGKVLRALLTSIDIH